MQPINSKGVSFLEIIIVLVILVVIVAVMLPAITPHHEDRSKFICLNNLKQCAIALQLYLDDYDGYLPSSALVNHSRKWNKQDFLTFATKTGNLSPKTDNLSPGTDVQVQTWPEILTCYMKMKDAIYCPTDSEKGSDGNRQVSYWWKLAIDKAWYGEHCKKPCRKESDFPYNSDQIVFYEHAGFHVGDTLGLKSSTQINVAYLDSHVKTITIYNSTSGNPIDCAANSDGEPMYFNYDNKTKKQLDKNTPAKFIDPARYSDKL